MNIGLIAHDSKKILMQNFCIAYRNILVKHHLFATGTTGRLIEEATNLSVRKYAPGITGGAVQLCADIEMNTIDLVIFLRDPLTKKPKEPRSTILYGCAICTISLWPPIWRLRSFW